MAAHTPARPIAYFDRGLAHPAVIVAGMVCATVCFLAVVVASVYCLAHRLDPAPVLKYLGPGAVVGAFLLLLQNGGVLALLPKLGRIERNTGASTVPSPRQPEPWEVHS